MKLAFNRRFLDDDGRPLNSGRITLYAHDSQTPLTIYYLEGGDYSPASNPMLTSNDGRIDTVFYDAAVIDVKVEKNNNDGTFELLDTFEEGIGITNNGGADTKVSTIDDLRNTDPSVGTVTVTGYYTEGDSPARMYMWDPDSTNTIDGGYVIGSEVSDTGRWILIWDDEMIPCTVYGIIPGMHEENISQFLDFPVTVGTKAIATARICRFITGEYSTTQSYYTQKTLYFDSGAKFTNGDFSCKDVIIPSNNDYVADFTFNGVQKEAHSSWFKTVQAFLTCNAQRYVINATNYFATTTLSGNVRIENAEMVFHGRLPVTYDGTPRITFSRCSMHGSGMFNVNDILGFEYTEIHDEWWTTPQNIDWTNNVRARSIALNKLLLQNFQNTAAYVNAIKADDQTKCDLGGRYISSLNANGFTTVSNAVCDTFTYSTQTGTVEIRNVKSDTAYLSGLSLTIRNCELKQVNASTVNYLICENSNISFGTAPTFSYMWLTDCDVDGGSIWTCKGGVVCEGGVFNASLNYVTDNTSNHGAVKFTRVRFGVNNLFTLKNLAIYDSTLDNNTVKMYPYKDGDDYCFSIDLENNIIRNTNPIEFTKLDEIDGMAQEDVYDIILRWTIVNNVFLGNPEGLRMRYWQRRLGQYYGRTFVKMAQNAHSIVYQGNTGNCPADNMRGVSIVDNTAYTTEEYGDSTIYKYRNNNRRCMMNPVSPIWWNINPIGGPNTLIKYYAWENSPYDSLSYSMFIHTTWFSYPMAHDESLNNGDFFALAVCTFGDYIRIVQRGDSDHNQGIIAKII